MSLTENPQKALALVLGYDGDISNHLKLTKGTPLVEDNKEYECKFCGRVHSKGVMGPKNSLINNNNNDFYNMANPHSPFGCEYCYFNNKNYAKKANKKIDVGNAVLYGDRIVPIDVSAKNGAKDLYDIFVSPPKEDFAILVKEIKGSSFTNMTFSFKPTIDSDFIVVNHGHNNYCTDRNDVIKCAKEALDFLKKHKKVKPSEDLFFNRVNSSEYDYYLTKKLRNNKEFMDDYRYFIDRFPKGERVVAKMILPSVRKDLKLQGE